MIISNNQSTNILFTAQKEAAESLNSHFFPLYVESDTLSSSLCNRVHNSLEQIHRTVLLISQKAFEIFNTVYASIEWAVKPFVDSFYPINPINGKRHISLISRETEKWVGDSILFPLTTLNFVSTQEKLPYTKEKMATIVDKITAALVAHNQELLNPPGETAFDYATQTVTDPRINAFASPGGKMVVFSQLLKELAESEIKESTIQFKDGTFATVNLEGVTVKDAIAFLIGHEMTHIASRHFLTLALETITQAAFGTEFFGAAGEFFSYLSHCFNSRQREFEADLTGAYFAHKAGFDPRGALYLNQLLISNKSPQVQKLLDRCEILLTHPQGNKRLLSLFTGIATFAPESLQGKVSWIQPSSSPYDLKGASSALLSADKIQKYLKQHEPVPQSPPPPKSFMPSFY